MCVCEREKVTEKVKELGGLLVTMSSFPEQAKPTYVLIYKPPP